MDSRIMTCYSKMIVQWSLQCTDTLGTGENVQIFQVSTKSRDSHSEEQKLTTCIVDNIAHILEKYSFFTSMLIGTLKGY